MQAVAFLEKETKALRKKMKRQEIANRAAEKELAEISLEQQVLRELRAKQTQKPGPGELQTMSQASAATSVTDLTTSVSSSTPAVYAKSQPALAVNWASVMEKSQARISCLCSNCDFSVLVKFSFHAFSAHVLCETVTAFGLLFSQYSPCFANETK